MQKLLIAATLAGLFVAAQAQADAITDKYNKTCAACHATGAAGAPKAGDKAAWAPRVKQGDAVLLKHAKEGIRAMPPKGLCMDCTDADFKALIKYMHK
jgi:cytochrome c5